jgi:hypothetical protein
MNQEFKIVEGRPDLVRDPTSGAIVNTNRSAYEQAVAAAKKAKEKNDKLDSAIEDINNLKEELTDIKSMLSQILQKV